MIMSFIVEGGGSRKRKKERREAKRDVARRERWLTHDMQSKASIRGEERVMGKKKRPPGWLTSWHKARGDDMEPTELRFAMGKRAPKQARKEGEDKVDEGRTTGEDPEATGARIASAITSRKTNPKKTPEDVEAQAIRIGKKINKKHFLKAADKIWGGTPKSRHVKVKELGTPKWEEGQDKVLAALKKSGRAGTEAETKFAGTLRGNVKKFIKDRISRN